MPSRPDSSSESDHSAIQPDEPAAADDEDGDSLDRQPDPKADAVSDGSPRRTRAGVSVPDEEVRTPGSEGLTGFTGLFPSAAISRVFSDRLRRSISASILPNFGGIWQDVSSKFSGQANIRGLFKTPGPTAWMKGFPELTGAHLATRGLFPSILGVMDVGMPARSSFIHAPVAPMMPAFTMPDLSSLFQLPPFTFDFSEFARALKLRRVTPNWLDVATDPDLIQSQIHAVLADGIPLGWVPGAAVIEKLLQAVDGPARRRVVSNNWRGILNDCDAAASALPSPRALFLADMIRRAIAALRAGHTEAAQALATNVLDTVISRFQLPTLNLDKGAILNPGQKPKLAAHGWRLAFSLLPVHATMTGKYGSDHRGTAFHRNITAHAANRRQYNRINAVIAIMLATSVLACAVTDTPTFD